MNKQETANDFLRTDSGNAELFASLYGKRVRFDHKQGRWLIWKVKQKQHRWIEDMQGEVRRAMTMTARQRLRDALKLPEDHEDRNQQVKWALRSESRYVIDASLELAKSVPPISDDGEKWDVNPWLLGVANGVVDLRTRRLRPAKPEDRVTLYSPVEFDAAAKCPRFEQFLYEVFNGDVETIRFIQRAVGYSLTGSVEEHCLFACYGAGANGKSTLLGVLHYILGDYGVNLPFSALEIAGKSSITNDEAMLAGRRFATAIETGESVRLNEARIKGITGGDPITARHLYHENFTFSPTHKLWLAFNHKPRIADNSEGMWRRIRLIPFVRQFTGNERDKKLLDTLKAEAPGILAWAVRGCRLWRKGGLGEPLVVTNATAAYRDESDHLTQFIEDCCVVEPNATVTSADLWKGYQEWTQENEEVPLSRAALGERLKRRGINDDRFGHNGTRGWRGIALLPQSEAALGAQPSSLDEVAERPN